MGTLHADLQSLGFELLETHISWVFMNATDVWKVKKPVALGFVDFSTVDRRRDACHAEVRLNRRLASDVYHGVVPVTVGPDGVHRIAGPGDVVDWAVHMRRLPMARRADQLLRRGLLELDQIESVALTVARFHETARCDEETGRFGCAEVIRRNIFENFEQTRGSIGEYVEPSHAQEIEDWQTAFLDRHSGVLARRIQSGRVRDGHGDLRLEHIYFEESGDIVVLDCIEFNDRFRYADVAADVAFLAMDLTWQGRADLAEAFLAAYAREASDYDLYAVVDFYESYRAYVRGKIASIMARDATANSDARTRATEDARRYFLLALGSERRSILPPAVVAVGGIIASGKSTVAAQLSREMAAPVIDADRTRKHLLGVASTTPLRDVAWSGAYSPRNTHRVYGEMLRRASMVLESGRPVILDASFRSGANRAAARSLAHHYGVPFTFVECQAPLACCRARLQGRARQASVSDGRSEIFEVFAASWEPISEINEREIVRMDTTQPLERNLDALRQILPVWPAGMTG